MQNSRFLGKKTMAKIIEKLRRMRFIIGSSTSSPLPSITYTPDSFLHTLCSIHTARTKLIPQFTGKTIDKLHNEYPCYMTNASYFPESNDIYLPWGILQYPFYSNKFNELLGWNHGGIGAIICHEITHAFDLEGSMFTPRGQYKDTWTRKSRRSFKKQTRKISNFFGLFTHYGKRVNGKRTVSENWADLGGVKLSLHCLKRELSELKASDAEIKEAYRNFFIAYASSWASLYRKKSLIFSISKDSHAPEEDRVDRIVPQFQEWVDAFDIKETDPLYLAPGKRLKFF
jgi:predicted metalloendopeptidase